MHHWQICIPVMDTGYYWDNSGYRPDGMTLNDTIVMDIFWLWTTLNEYWLWTRCNQTIVMDHMEYYLVLVNIVCGPREMPPLTWIMTMDHM